MKIRSETGLIRDLIKDEIVLADLSWQLSGNNLRNGWGSWSQSVSPRCDMCTEPCDICELAAAWTLIPAWIPQQLEGIGKKPNKWCQPIKETLSSLKKIVGGSVRAHPKSSWALSRFLVMQKGEGNMESISEGSLWHSDACACMYRLLLAASKPLAQGIVSFCDPFYTQKKQKSFYNEQCHFLLLCCRKSPSPLNPRNLHSVVNNNEVYCKRLSLFHPPSQAFFHFFGGLFCTQMKLRDTHWAGIKVVLSWQCWS